ncbi:MAG: hypothetical protein GY928_40330, partial [Colwellia sp.]|nr:hypothetical protein [Colwellia sp.]
MIYSSCIAAKAAAKFKKSSLSRQILSSILICLFCLSYIPLNANAAEPKVNYFRWESNVVEVNKAAYFKWNISNVSSCTSTVSGAKSTSGRIGPIIWTEPRESTTKWYCTDLNGNRYPSSGYLEAHISVIHPRPKVKKFYWHPSVTTFGKKSYFYWDIENVTSCTSTVSGTQPTNGRLGPYRFSTLRDSTTKWYCTDLNGDRYPTNGYLEARHKVYPSASKNTFAWSPSTINVGETSTLVWDIRNVTECRSTTMGTKRANNNNVSGSARGRVNNTVGFINERFRCKDLSGSWVYYDAPLSIKHPEPNLVKFGWSRSPVDVGVETSFEWQIDNVTDCTSLASGPKASNGTIGPMKLYGNGSTSTTQWHCKDLDGDRY